MVKMERYFVVWLRTWFIILLCSRLIPLYASNGDSSTKRTIHVAVAGTLPDLIPESEKYTIEELTLSGELNGTDFRLLRDMAGNNYLGVKTDGILSVLDIKDVNVVVGGEKYLDTNYISGYQVATSGNFNYKISQNDEIPEMAFWGCYLKAISMPKSVKVIGRHAFGACKKFISINMIIRI